MEKRPRLAITMGDPAGVGPEICARALLDPGVAEAADCVVYGDGRAMARAFDLAGRKAPKYALVDLQNADPAAFEPGKVSGPCGLASWEYVRAAARDALDGKVDALVTAPINKESVRAAGLPHIGHTEMLASLSGTADPLTMFETLGLRVFFLTRHVSLRRACDLVTRDRLSDYLRRCAGALRGIGVDGAIAVAGLNPHCGEHGLFGDEEGSQIVPAIEEARAAGLAVEGPIGADSVFHLARTGRYAAVLSLYHDQGHIACKTLDFERTVSLTLGMSFLRASVDHGTAFDIACKGLASPVSMVEAILAAARYSTRQ